MNYFDTLEKKRNHVKTYSDRVVDKKMIERALWKRGKLHQEKTMQWHIKH